VTPGAEKIIGAHCFRNWGSHSNHYPDPYLTTASAIGLTREEIDLFITKLDKVFDKFRKRQTHKPTVNDR